MTRDELVEAGVQVLAEWYGDEVSEVDVVALLDTWEPLIRADERATIKYEMGVLQWDGLRLRQERANLRAKVEAHHSRVKSAYRDEGDHYYEGSMDAYGVVIALLDRSSDD